MSSNRTYFANCKANDIPDDIVGRYSKLQAWWNPMADKWSQAMAMYYGDNTIAGRTWTTSRRGEEGELSAIRINRARTLSKARQALITSSQVRLTSRAKQDSAGSAYSATLAKTILEGAWKTQDMAAFDRQATEISEVTSQVYGFGIWDRTRGNDTQPSPGGTGLIRAGDVRLYALPPWYVQTDPFRARADDEDWWYVRLERPKADLIQLYSKLLNGATGEEAAQAIWDVQDPWLRVLQGQRPSFDTDLAPEIHFIHRPTLALPQGRHVIFSNAEVVYRDTTLVGKDGDYELCPVVRMASDEYIDSPFGWTSFFDTLAVQEVMDALDTTLATTITTYGNQSLMYEKGTDFDPDNVSKGFRPIELQPGQTNKPSFLAPAELSDGHLKIREEWKADQREIAGLNEAALGQTSQTEKNAQADALAASMAVQQAGSAVQGRRTFLSKIGNLYLTTLRKNVTDKRLLEMVGKSESNLLADTKFWTGKDLGGFADIEVDEVSPMEQTQQGRQVIVKEYGEAGLLATPQDIEEVRNTGRLEGAVNPVRDQELLWRAQNEMLQAGKIPPCHPTENQVASYQKNAAVLKSITALNSPTIQGAVQKVLDTRYAYYYGVAPTGDPLEFPRRRFLLGQGPEPIPQPMPPPGGPPGPPPPDAGGPPPQEAAPKMPVPPGGPSIPTPKNPINGQPMSPGEPPPPAA